MSGQIALCIDEATCRNPELIGLDGESLETQSWLDVFQAGDEARSTISADGDIREAWVASCEDVDPINLAATLKADRPSLCVRLVAFEGCGSLYSRAHTANIDEVIDPGTFLRRYAEAKSKLSCSAPKPCGPAGGEGQAPSAGPAVERATGAVTEPAAEPIAEPAAEAQAAPATGPAGGQGPLILAPPSSSSPEGAPLGQAAATALSPVVANRAFLMPVVSGSGGAGKSSVSTIGAFIARDMGYRTLLLDYDLQFGDIGIMAGVENALAIDEAMAFPDRLEHEIRRDAGLAVLAAPRRLETAESIVAALPGFLDAIAGAFDVIIANTGAAWAEQHAALLERCSCALFLIDQRASSVRACRHALELCARCGIASGPFQFAVNRCAKNAPLTSSDVSCALQGAPVFELRDGGRDVEDYLGGGAAAELLESRNEFCTSLEQVLSRLLPGGDQRIDVQASIADDKRAGKRRGRHAGRKRGWSPS